MVRYINAILCIQEKVTQISLTKLTGYDMLSCSLVGGLLFGDYIVV